jgi:hypothetical protein
MQINLSDRGRFRAATTIVMSLHCAVGHTVAYLDSRDQLSVREPSSPNSFRIS